jgi:hypothetical protein
MVIGEVILKQYVIKRETFWSDLRLAILEFNDGIFDDNDFECMVEKLESIPTNLSVMQKFSLMMEQFVEMMTTELDERDYYSVKVDCKVVQDAFVLAYTHQQK